MHYFCWFLKNVIDWSDGLLARIKKTTSNLGDVLDRWGSVVGYNSFILGFGFYLYHDSDNNPIFLFLMFSIIFLKSIDLKDFVYHLMGYKFIKETSMADAIKFIKLNKKLSNTTNQIKFQSFKNRIVMLLDDSRSHTIDLIAFIILIDNFYYNLFFVDFIFYLIFFKNSLFFLGGIYVSCFKNYLIRNTK